MGSVIGSLLLLCGIALSEGMLLPSPMADVPQPDKQERCLDRAVDAVHECCSVLDCNESEEQTQCTQLGSEVYQTCVRE